MKIFASTIRQNILRVEIQSVKTKLFLEEMHEVCQSARVTNKDTHTPNPSKRQENIYIEREYTIAPDVLMHSISS